MHKRSARTASLVHRPPRPTQSYSASATVVDAAADAADATEQWSWVLPVTLT